MADNNAPGGAMALELIIQRSLGQMRCAMPGVIVEFNSSTQRAKVQPGIKMKNSQGTNVKYLDLPIIENVPVVVPYAQGAGLLLTLPIKPDDQCLLVFSDRSIDNFLKTGKNSTPNIVTENDTATPRTHSLTDAIAIPGIIADPVVVDSWDNDHIELRDKTRTNYISLGQDGIVMTDGQAKWTMSGGKVTLDAPAGISNTSSADITNEAATKYEVTAPQINLTGNITTTGTGGAGGTMKITGDIEQTGSHTSTGDQVAGGISQTGHKHTGVTPGGSNTGGPV